MVLKYRDTLYQDEAGEVSWYYGRPEHEGFIFLSKTMMRSTPAKGTFKICLRKLNVAWLCARVLFIVGSQIDYMFGKKTPSVSISLP